MSLISSDARFLGVDLALLWRDMREPWRNVHQWLVFAWLTPQPAVLLHQADGQQSVWQGGKKPVPGLLRNSRQWSCLMSMFFAGP